MQASEYLAKPFATQETWNTAGTAVSFTFSPKDGTDLEVIVANNNDQTTGNGSYDYEKNPTGFMIQGMTISQASGTPPPQDKMTSKNTINGGTVPGTGTVYAGNPGGCSGTGDVADHGKLPRAGAAGRAPPERGGGLTNAAKTETPRENQGWLRTTGARIAGRVHLDARFSRRGKLGHAAITGSVSALRGIDDALEVGGATAERGATERIRRTGAGGGGCGGGLGAAAIGGLGGAAGCGAGGLFSKGPPGDT